MEAFWTGFFTLSAAIGGVWLKDHLDRKKSYKSTIKQKALEAYILSSRLIHTHNAKEVICLNLIQDATYHYHEMLKNFPDTTFPDLENLELLIIENFYDLNDDFTKLNKIIVGEASILFGIISNPKSNSITSEEFDKRKKEYQNEVISTSRDLKKKLIDQYINKAHPPINLFDSVSIIKKTMKNFFKKTET